MKVWFVAWKTYRITLGENRSRCDKEIRSKLSRLSEELGNA